MPSKWNAFADAQGLAGNRFINADVRHDPRDNTVGHPGFIPKDNLKYLCDEGGRGTRAKLAQALGVGREKVTKWISGEEYMSNLNIARTAAFFKVNPLFLLDFTGENIGVKKAPIQNADDALTAFIIDMLYSHPGHERNPFHARRITGRRMEAAARAWESAEDSEAAALAFFTPDDSESRIVGDTPCGLLQGEACRLSSKDCRGVGRLMLDTIEYTVNGLTGKDMKVRQAIALAYFSEIFPALLDAEDLPGQSKTADM